MTTVEYNRLKDALIKQMEEAASSREAADRFIDELGIRHLLVPIEKNDKPIKATAKKAPSLKAAASKKVK